MNHSPLLSSTLSLSPACLHPSRPPIHVLSLFSPYFFLCAPNTLDETSNFAYTVSVRPSFPPSLPLFLSSPDPSSSTLSKQIIRLNPPFFPPVPQVSLIKYAFEALCINEFQGLEFTAEKRIGPGREGGREEWREGGREGGNIPA